MPNTEASSNIHRVRHIIDRVVSELQETLADGLVGIYLYGSLVSGDFDIAISDIDLVVALKAKLNQGQFLQLQEMHARIVSDHPAWRNRLELAYISRRALKTFRVATSTIGIISPGEPFHLIQAGDDWLISWYDLRRNGIALLGPPIKTLIDPIPAPDWLDAVREHIRAYRRSVTDAADISFLSYIVLTVARGSYTLTHGHATSKVEAAAWARASYPRWSGLIASALRWRLGDVDDAPAIEPARTEVASYVNDMLSGIDQGKAAAAD